VNEESGEECQENSVNEFEESGPINQNEYEQMIAYQKNL
jgi:hypothetical protein